MDKSLNVLLSRMDCQASFQDCFVLLRMIVVYSSSPSARPEPSTFNKSSKTIEDPVRCVAHRMMHFPDGIAEPSRCDECMGGRPQAAVHSRTCARVARAAHSAVE